MSEEKDQTNEKPTIFVDASSLKDSSCLRRLIYNNFYGFRLVASNRNYKQAYGSAFHKALEYFYGQEKRTPEVEQEAIQQAVKYYSPYTTIVAQQPDYEFRTSDHLVKSIEAYFAEYNQDAETLKPIKGLIEPGLLETKFTYPAELLDERLSSPHFNLVVAGTIDMIATYLGEEIFVDHKSTGTKWGYRKGFFEEYDLSIQMMLYSLILKKLTGNYFRFIINGIFIKATTQAAKKDDLFDGVNFERYGPRSYGPEQLEQFEKIWLIPRILEFHRWLTNWFNVSYKDMTHDASKITTPNFSSCFPKFECPYVKVCSLNPDYQGARLMLWNRESYNPLKFGEQA